MNNITKTIFICIVSFFVSSSVMAMHPAVPKEKGKADTPAPAGAQEDTFDRLKREVQEKLGKDHETLKWFQTQNLPLIKRALKELMSYVSSVDPALTSIGRLATEVFLAYDQLPRKQFQQKAGEYFSKLPGCVAVSFQEKTGGDQLGNKVVVKYLDGQEITYHAKTHRGGLKSQHSSSAQPVDLKELLIYKILEHCGAGVEVRFFYDDIKNFYIATKDAGYSDIKHAVGEFIKYDKIREVRSTGELQKDPVIVHGFIKADVLSRLLMLSDVLNNGGNVGVSSHQEFKIIDFNPPVTRAYTNPKIFEDWLSGNNQYNYSDMTVLLVLKKDPAVKIAEVRKTMEELRNFELTVARAFEETTGVIKGLEIPEAQIEDLRQYSKSIVYNHGVLSSGIAGAK